jgi:hypothetical protein
MLERARLFRDEAEAAPDIFKCMKAMALADDCEHQAAHLQKQIDEIEMENYHGKV